MNKNSKRKKPAVLAANIGAKRKSINPKVAKSGGHGMSLAEQHKAFYGIK